MHRTPIVAGLDNGASHSHIDETHWDSRELYSCPLYFTWLNHNRYIYIRIDTLVYTYTHTLSLTVQLISDCAKFRRRRNLFEEYLKKNNREEVSQVGKWSAYNHAQRDYYLQVLEDQLIFRAADSAEATSRRGSQVGMTKMMPKEGGSRRDRESNQVRRCTRNVPYKTRRE